MVREESDSFEALDGDLAEPYPVLESSRGMKRRVSLRQRLEFWWWLSAAVALAQSFLTEVYLLRPP